MSFGRRGVRADASNFNGGLMRGAISNAAIGGADDYVLKFTPLDSLIGAVGAAVCYWVLEPTFHGARMDIEGAFISLMSGIGLIGCLFFIFMGLSGKTKFKADSTGISRDQLFNTSHMRWEDIEGFEILTVNYNKIVFAKATKSGGLTSSKKVTIPNAAFKSKDAEFLGWAAARRPDLVPLILGVMTKVGAKKLARSFVDAHAGSDI